MTAGQAERERIASASLNRIAELRGDITAEVIQRYYAAEPEARVSFVFHGLGDVAGLESRMVAESIFLLMRWVENPAAARIEQGTTVVHHNDTLEVGPRWYFGLVDAVLSVLEETIPPEHSAERNLWQEVRGEITAFVDGLRGEFRRAVDPRPLDGRSPDANDSQRSRW